LGERFEYLRRLGQGGMAEGYLAVDRFHEREVALKYILISQATAVHRRYSNVITTLPLWCPAPKYRIASGTSLNLRSSSITGLTFPASKSSHI
jgi:serine/threonine protein kinase